MSGVLNFWALFLGSLVLAAASAGIPYSPNRDDVFLVIKIVLPLGLC
jgi:hypothetical protein